MYGAPFSHLFTELKISTDRRFFASVTNERALLSKLGQPVRKVRQTPYCVFQAGKQTFKDRHIFAIIWCIVNIGNGYELNNIKGKTDRITCLPLRREPLDHKAHCWRVHSLHSLEACNVPFIECYILGPQFGLYLPGPPPCLAPISLSLTGSHPLHLSLPLSPSLLSWTWHTLASVACLSVLYL